MQKKLVIVLSIIAGIYLLLFLTGNKHVPRTLWMTIFLGKMGPDIDELNDFPTRKIEAGKPLPWPLSSKFNKQSLSKENIAYFKQFETTAYLVFHKDSLLFEWYDLNYNATTLSNSFSMAKSFTAALIGCALKDGFIKSLDEPIGNYLPEFAQGIYAPITIKHALMMSTGLDFKESYGSMFAWPAKAYYGTDVNATLKDAPKVNEPGAVYAYKGGDTQLLGMILEKATGMRVSAYAAKRLWQPMGAEADAFWSLDVDDGMEKVSCCYYATARDFARFGKLYLQKGWFNQQQLIDSSFIEQSLVPGAPKKESSEPNTEYGFQWWLLNHKEPVFYARGIRGQYVFVMPQSQTIVVRLGHKRAEKKGDELPSDIFQYLNFAKAIVSNTNP